MTRSLQPLRMLSWLVGAVGLAAAVTLGMQWWGLVTAQGGAAVQLAGRTAAPSTAMHTRVADEAPAERGAADGERRVAPVGCPFQRIEISAAQGAPVAACLDATRVQQNGGVRSYVAAGSGTGASALQIDLAGGVLLRATLRTADGRSFACEAAACRGLTLGRHDARGLRSVNLAAVPLRQEEGGDAGGRVRVSGRLAVPADDLLPGLACAGPGIMMNSPDGSLRRFCGQAGAGVEIADDGTRHYRFEDAEGHVMAVSVDGEQRVTQVEYGGLACRGAACSGARMTAAAPHSELSERTFFFGRTPLYSARAGSGAAARPQLLLDGSLSLPSQE